jgi:signal transduction histidine kinase
VNLKSVLYQLNIVGQCRKYRLPIWQCPNFMFLMMGLAIIFTSLTIYGIGTRYVLDPDLVSLIVLAVTIVLFVIAFSITRGLEGLAEASRLKSEFISIVSHQLRSPISNLKWAAEVLHSKRFGEINDKQLEYIKMLGENSDRMAELVSDLLMVSKIEQGSLTLQKTAFSLVNLTKEVISGFNALAEASNVKIKTKFAESLPNVFADPARIKVVIENLIDNAIRYIKESGEVLIEVTSQGENILFRIEDNGVGIPREDQKHIFQRFFRSQNILRHQTQGSGLGLSIVKPIMEKSGGKIWFKSEENKGSTFYFTLPTKT